MCKRHVPVYSGHLLIAYGVNFSIVFLTPCCTKRYLIMYIIYKHALSCMNTFQQYMVLLVLPLLNPRTLTGIQRKSKGKAI